MEEENLLSLNNKIFSNNNNILFEITKDLKELKDDITDNIILKRLGDIIKKIDNIFNKNTEFIKNELSKLNSKIDSLKINQKYEEKKYNQGGREKYIVELSDDVPNGKGKMIWKNGDIYEGEWKNDNKEGKGIYYKNDGSKYDGYFKNGLQEGKGIMYYANGDRYEGDWVKGKWEGKGIYYYLNGEKRKEKNK